MVRVGARGERYAAFWYGEREGRRRMSPREESRKAREFPTGAVEARLIVALEASAQLDIMPSAVRQAARAALRDLRDDPYGGVNNQGSPGRLVYHVQEGLGGLEGLMILEDDLYKIRYQVIAGARGTYAKVLSFTWWEEHPSQLEQRRQARGPRRNEGDYEFAWITNMIERARRVPSPSDSWRFIGLGRRRRSG
jgi:hypothetical protein